jgi:hypothetical protein
MDFATTYNCSHHRQPLGNSTLTLHYLTRRRHGLPLSPAQRATAHMSIADAVPSIVGSLVT